MLARYLGQVSVNGSYLLSPSQINALGISQFRPRGPIDIFVDQYGPQACFSGVVYKGDSGESREYTCVRIPLATEQIASILGINLAPPPIASPKVTTGPVETSGPVDGGLISAPTPTPQPWTDIAVPAPDAYAGGTPGFDFTSETGAPSELAPSPNAPSQPAPKTFPWWIAAVGAALLLGS